MTAKEFLEGNEDNAPWTGSQEEALIEFAKFHVTEALKQAENNFQITLASFERDLDIIANRGDYIRDEFIGVIENSYPLTNIK